MMENKRGKKIICIDIGGTAIKSGIMDENMNFLRTDVMDTPRGGAGIMDAVLERISEYLSTAANPEAVCVSSAGIIDSDRGVVAEANENLIPGYTGMNISEKVRERFEIPCYVENDVNCAAMAEAYQGVGRGHSSMLMLTVGTGIGGAFLERGKLLKGHTCTIETYGFDKTADLYAEDLELVKKPGELGIDFLVKSNVKDAPADFRVEVPTPGRFSVYNALTAIAVCRHFKVSVPQIQKALLSAHVRGRIEMVPVSPDFTLLIDYAHNAMSLKSILTTLREYEPKRLVCLFGCGGNRSKIRRYEMGEVSGNLADLTIITSDNPRDEEPQDIINDIKTGMAKTNGKYVEICDRKEAIAYAIHHGQPGDIIVLAGKGHEDYQEIKGVKYPMDERDLIRDILAGK